VALTKEQEVGMFQYVIKFKHKTTEQYSPAGAVTGVIGVTRILPSVVPLVLTAASTSPVACNTEMTDHSSFNYTENTSTI
jgi:hypothetical protein